MAASETGAAPGQAGAQAGGRVRLERIYLKDLSFESPRAPDVFRLAWRPAVQLDINTQANPLAPDRFKAFRAVCPETRRQRAQATSGATSGVGKAFLA